MLEHCPDERAISLARPPFILIPEDLQRMTDLTTSMVRQSLDAFVHLDARLARTVCRRAEREVLAEARRVHQTDRTHPTRDKTNRRRQSRANKHHWEYSYDL